MPEENNRKEEKVIVAPFGPVHIEQEGTGTRKQREIVCGGDRVKTLGR